MPVGLKLRVPSNEIREYFDTLLAKVEEESEKAQAEIDRMKAAGISEERNSQRGTPYDNLRQTVRDCIRSASRYKFVRDHLMEEDYEITEREWSEWDREGGMARNFFMNTYGKSAAWSAYAEEG